MKLIPLQGPLSPAEHAAIERFRAQSGSTPFLCLNDRVMLLLTPGSTRDALLKEAQTLMKANLAARPAVFVHTLPDAHRMVRTIRDLCILETAPGSSFSSLLQQGLAACRHGRAAALVIPEEEDAATLLAA